VRKEPYGWLEGYVPREWKKAGQRVARAIAAKLAG
jgi:hypothetical protein